MSVSKEQWDAVEKECHRQWLEGQRKWRDAWRERQGFATRGVRVKTWKDWQREFEAEKVKTSRGKQE